MTRKDKIIIIITLITLIICSFLLLNELNVPKKNSDKYMLCSNGSYERVNESKMFICGRLKPIKNNYSLNIELDLNKIIKNVT